MKNRVRKRKLSDAKMLQGALGGWVNRSTSLDRTARHNADGSVVFYVKITVPAKSAAKAREEYANREGGWAGT